MGSTTQPASSQSANHRTATANSGAPLTLEDVDFNRRFNEDRPLRPMPPGRDDVAERWRESCKFMFGNWIDVDAELQPSDFTRVRDDLYWQADEKIIPVVDIFEREGPMVARRMFEKALTEGIDAVPDAPAELIEFFTELTETPPWFDRESAERGRILISTSTLSAVRATLGWGLFETIMTSDISSTTGATARFKFEAVTRYIETLRMFAMLLTPKIYDPTTEEFQTVIRVRLMHGLASRGLRKAWGDEHYLHYGEPIAATALLGFGNGPLLARLVDHRLGRPLSTQDLDDLAMFSNWFGFIIGAPDRLLAKDGMELLRSLNYVFAHGGDPSEYRQEIFQTVRLPFDAYFETYMPTLPLWLRNFMTVLGCKAVALLFIGPLVPIFGVKQIEEYVEGVSEFSSPYRLYGAIFSVTSRINARTWALLDRIPRIVEARRRHLRNGTPGIKKTVARMAAFARHYRKIALAYTHHDASPSGAGFGPPRPHPNSLPKTGLGDANVARTASG